MCGLPEETWETSVMEKPLNERIKILKKGELCYGCLKTMAKDHNAKNCQQRLTCKIYTACHPTNNSPWLCSKNENKQQLEHISF